MTRGTACGRVGSGFTEFIYLIFYRRLTSQRGMRSRDIALVFIGLTENVPRGTYWVEIAGLGFRNVPRGTMRPDPAVLEQKLRAFQDRRRPTYLDYQVGVR